MEPFWTSASQSVVPSPVSPGNVLQMRILRLCSRLTELETLVAGSNNLF